MRIDVKILSSALLLGVIILLGSCAPQAPETPLTPLIDEPSLVAVNVDKVTEARLRNEIGGLGVIQGIREVILRSQTQGTIEELAFELGDRLVAGQEILRVDSQLLQLSVKQLRQQLDNAQAELKLAEELSKTGGLSQNEINRQRNSVALLEVQWEQARENLKRTSIRAPFKGVVADKADSFIPGSSLSQGQVIGRIVDLNRVKITLGVGEREVPLIQKGQRAEMILDTILGSYKAQGFVSSVSAGASDRTGSYTVISEFENPAPEVLKSGMSAQVRIFSDKGPVSLIVPTASLFNLEGKSYVYLVQEELITPVEIKVIDTYGNLTSIQPIESNSLLSKSSLVVTSGLSRVRPGDRVTAQLNTPVMP